MLTTKQGKVQVLVSYSSEHKKHMREEREIACQALSDLVKSAIERANGKVTKITPLSKGFADLMIEGNVAVVQLKTLHTFLKNINREVGAEKVYVFGA
jgi:hypothetical protein